MLLLAGWLAVPMRISYPVLARKRRRKDKSISCQSFRYFCRCFPFIPTHRRVFPVTFLCLQQRVATPIQLALHSVDGEWVDGWLVGWLAAGVCWGWLLFSNPNHPTTTFNISSYSTAVVGLPHRANNNHTATITTLSSHPWYNFALTCESRKCKTK